MLRAWQLLLYSKWPTYFAYAAYAHLSKVFEARVGCQVYRNQFPHCWLRALRVAPRGWRNRNRFGSLLHTARVRWSSKSKMVCIYIYTHNYVYTLSYRCVLCKFNINEAPCSTSRLDICLEKSRSCIWNAWMKTNDSLWWKLFRFLVDGEISTHMCTVYDCTYILPRKLAYPLKNDDWTTIFRPLK